MERSPIKDIEIKHLLQNALVDEINSHEIFMKSINISYYYEEYTEYNIEDL
ncbi:cell filamentation protein Fic [Bacillus sp. DU-106]|nr:cell filamentation protein Fic [Bacillus cereus]AZR80358.1 cell filamentation protein Fic [Bacillus thuringiensis]QCC43671.1 cell filamentation protein Fic [Bacillus sp. DU-106]QCX97359.1 cell filamentation protein Fic [Bacillus cereus ATCC 14579]RKN57122.1 cell filamentation protein Fic [Bacillus sp. S66]